MFGKALMPPPDGLEAVAGSIRDDSVAELVTLPEADSMPGMQAVLHLVDTYLTELARDLRRNLAVLALSVASIRELPATWMRLGARSRPS
jgi:hypothetical protein